MNEAEHPIIFGAWSIPRILDGSKTQTRRPIKKALHQWGGTKPGFEWAGAVHPARESGWVAWWPGTMDTATGLALFTRSQYEKGFPCPYGVPGDLLWVRESFWVNIDSSEWNRYSVEQLREQTFYKADPLPDLEGEEIRIPWNPSIFMPRWASRITLVNRGIRVERVQAISREDAWAEGIVTHGALNNRNGIDNRSYNEPQDAFKVVWDTLYEKTPYAWEHDPWVLVVSFERVEESQRSGGGEE